MNAGNIARNIRTRIFRAISIIFLLDEFYSCISVLLFGIAFWYCFSVWLFSIHLRMAFRPCSSVLFFGLVFRYLYSFTYHFHSPFVFGNSLLSSESRKNGA